MNEQRDTNEQTSKIGKYNLANIICFSSCEVISWLNWNAARLIWAALNDFRRNPHTINFVLLIFHYLSPFVMERKYTSFFWKGIKRRARYTTFMCARTNRHTHTHTHIEHASLHTHWLRACIANYLAPWQKPDGLVDPRLSITIARWM